MTRATMTSLGRCLTPFIFGLFVAGAAQASPHLSLPQWQDIFNPDGTLIDDVGPAGISGPNAVADFIDLYDGATAEFIQENLSQGLATDMSALISAKSLNDEAIFRGPVRPEHDLGHAFLMIGHGGQYFVGVERVSSARPTFVDFELNQDRVHLRQGSPWLVHGERTAGDLRVRFVFSGGELETTQLYIWSKNQWRNLRVDPEIDSGGCGAAMGFSACLGTPPFSHPETGLEMWDENARQVVNPPADQFLEVGLDIPALLGEHIKFSSLQIRTPEDIAFTAFGHGLNALSDAK